MAVYGVLASQRDVEDLSATVHDAEPVLVVGACDVGNRDIKEAIPVALSAGPFGLAPDAIDTAGPLLDGRRVPWEVVVDDVAAFAVEVDTLLADGSGDEDLRYQGRVEAREEPIAFRAGDRARHVGDDIAVPGRLVVGGNLFL